MTATTGELASTVEYIGVRRIRDLIARTGPGPFIEALAAEIEADYARWTQFDKSARHASHSRDGVIELMPISDGTRYAFKYVNGHPKNTAHGLLTVTAFGVLSDVATGYPILLSELTIATALRTAAMSALAARRLARADSRSMAVIGNGSQSEFQVIAFHQMLQLREVRLYDTDVGATRKLQRNLESLGLSDLQIRPCPSTAAATEGADVVTTVTADKRNATILAPAMIAPGMHINAVGGDCPGKTELHRDILLRGDARVVVEYAPQSRIEGEIQQLPATFPVIEFHELVTGQQQGRRDASEVTIFDSVGFALEDFSTLRYLHRLNRVGGGQVEYIDLVPELDDPKNLYAALSGNRMPVRRRLARVR